MNKFLHLFTSTAAFFFLSVSSISADSSTCQTYPDYPTYDGAKKTNMKTLSLGGQAELRGFKFLKQFQTSIEKKIKSKSEIKIKSSNATTSKSSESIYINKSLFVNNSAYFDIEFSEVMNALAKSMNGKKSGIKIFSDWWATAALHPHDEDKKQWPYGCDFNKQLDDVDVKRPGFSSIINGAPYTCPREEGNLRNLDTFSIDDEPFFEVIALVNRGDLSEHVTKADKTPATCGEYRIIARSNMEAFTDWNLEKANKINISDKVFISFEFGLLNPGKNEKTKAIACIAIQKFWRRLSDEALSVKELRDLYRAFYFEGVKIYEDGSVIDPNNETGLPIIDVPKIISAENLGKPVIIDGEFTRVGQIRTNSRPDSQPRELMGNQWIMREYQVLKVDNSEDAIVPHTLNSVLEPTFLSIPDKARFVVSDLKENEKKIKSYLFEDLGFKASNCLQASELRLGVSTVKRSYPDIPRGEIPNSKPDKKKVSEKVAKKLEEIAKKYSLTDRQHQILRNIEFTSCSGCHGSLRKELIGYMKSERWQKNFKFGISNELAKFTHTQKLEHTTSSVFLVRTLLPIRCEIMHRTTNEGNAFDQSVFKQRMKASSYTQC